MVNVVPVGVRLQRGSVRGGGYLEVSVDPTAAIGRPLGHTGMDLLKHQRKCGPGVRC